MRAAARLVLDEASGPGAADSSDGDARPAIGTSGPAEPWHEATIFIVDDKSANVALLEGLLRKEGYLRLVTFTRSRDVMSAFETHPPDLVLLDLMMPYPDGFEILRRIGEEPESPRRPPVLVLTANVTREARDRALRAGAMDFLTKPFDHVEVLLRVRNLLARRALELDLLEQNETLERRVRARTRELEASLERLRTTSRQREALLARLVRAQEEERVRIAADIHDDPVQVMVAACLRLELLRHQLSDPGQRSATDAVRDSVEEALGRLRALMFDLRPPTLDDEGLAAALEQHLERRMAEGPVCVVTSELSEEPPPVLRTVLFRIAQEALANVRRHARARHVKVALREEAEGILLSVRDDGRGFDVGQAASMSGHIGLTTMAERAAAADGWFRCASSPGEGTVVSVWVPRPQGSGPEDPS